MLAAPPAPERSEAGQLATWLRQQEPRPRVWPIGVQAYAVQNDLAAQRIVNLGGYHAAKLQVSEELRRRVFEGNPPAVRLVNLLAARWLVLAQRLEAQTTSALEQLGMRVGPEPAFEGPEGIVYENLSAQPRAFVVENYEVTPRADASLLDRIASGEFDATRSVLLEKEPSPRPEPTAAQSVVVVEDEGFDWVRLRAQLPAAGVLVLADTYYPGWEARVDGEKTELYRANYAMRAIALPAGEHSVEFRIGGGSYRLGRRIAALSAVGLAAMFLFAGLSRWRRRAPVLA
jgi:hypothetical protein